MDGSPDPAAALLSAAFDDMARHSRVKVDVGTLGEGYTPLAALVADDRFLHAMIARQQASTPGLDFKGAAAYLVAEYAGIIGTIAAVPFLQTSIVPDFAPERLALAFAPPPAGGTTPELRLRFLSNAFASGDQVGLRRALRERLEAHFAPLITRLHSGTGLPARAMWRLVSDAVAARFLEAGRQLGDEETAKAEALAVLKQPGSALANNQLHFFEVTIREEAPPQRVLARRSVRSRGGCCRYYTAPGGSYCTTCVLVDPREQHRRVENRMRRQLGLPVEEPAPNERDMP